MASTLQAWEERKDNSLRRQGTVTLGPNRHSLSWQLFAPSLQPQKDLQKQNRMRAQRTSKSLRLGLSAFTADDPMEL